MEWGGRCRGAVVIVVRDEQDEACPIHVTRCSASEVYVLTLGVKPPFILFPPSSCKCLVAVNAFAPFLMPIHSLTISVDAALAPVASNERS